MIRNVPQTDNAARRKPTGRQWRGAAAAEPIAVTPLSVAARSIRSPQRGSKKFSMPSRATAMGRPPFSGLVNVNGTALRNDQQRRQTSCSKAFDTDERVIQPLLAAGKTPVIPPKARAKLNGPLIRSYTRRGISSRISSESSSNTAPLQRATTRLPEISSPQSIWQPQSSCSIEDRP